MHWIKCSDRLPPKRKKVLVFKPGREIGIGYRYIEANAFSMIGGGYMDNPTHWMKLPDQPWEARL